ncbi:two-component system, LytT family, sensor histidine kinase LytS [Lentibacillus persicus]|uniref:histidine kinase n=1 Tax=Lentibacillus persicus TaxID=640948 RepID=A0A1I1UIF6_9BACI|nr:LytS/YhcK type 5TM receptor domain-containing protein [Lentibacillus persicus]SFD68533.1 two-component system, LytT family, sensor histidine kinase LytS [Lentibacillus persicus]
MKDLTLILFERLGLLLLIAFVLTRTRGFRSLLDREFSKKMLIVHAFVFGLFGIAGTITGIVIEDGMVTGGNFVLTPVGDNQMVASLSLVPIVIAGLLGGPVVGFGAGIIAGLHLFFLCGLGVAANSLVNPITGLLAGWTTHFFSNERVIAPMKALFIGVFPPVLQMHMLLIAEPDSEEMITIVNTIGLPLVLSNSISIAIFTAMVGIVLKEQENEAALATRQAFTIAEEALPFLRKRNAPREMAAGIADLLYDRLDLAAVAVTDGRKVLAHKGRGADHHQEGDEIITSLSYQALESRQMQVAYSPDQIQCRYKNCPFEAAIFIPIIDSQEATGLIKFYFEKAQHIGPVERVLAKGLGQLITNQLDTIATEELKKHIRDAELRNLQAQINPHFLFNTLHMIAALFRKDAEKARHITVNLAHYMRFNIGLVKDSLVPLEKEYQHVKAYVEIIQARFSSQMTIHFKAPDDMLQAKIPPSTIQPLVENSIKHGLKNVTSGGEVTVLIEDEGSTIKIAVSDNGAGFPEELLEEAGKTSMTNRQSSGAGLYNVNQRLISLIGESARLHISNLPESGSEVYFTIPRQEY